MKLAVVGSRSVGQIEIHAYIPDGVTEIVSGGASGGDALARAYAKEQGILLTEFLPEYARYGRGAPYRRNRQIAEYADAVLAFWDGESRGTKHVVECFRRLGKPVRVILIE